MMLHTEMNPYLGNFGCPAAAEQLLFKRQNSFEDEVESIYLSNLKKQQDHQQQQQQPQDVGGAATPASTTIGGSNNLAAAFKPDIYDSMEFAVAKPEDVTGQTLASKVEDPEQDEDVSNILEANFDFSTLIDDDDMDVTDNTEIEGQKFIDEMKEFLGRFEEKEPAPNAWAKEAVSSDQVSSGSGVLPETLAEELLSMEQRQTLNNMPTEFPAMDENDMAQAEELLDMLIAGHGQQEQPTTDILQQAMDDSGFQGDDSVLVEEEEATAVAPAVVPAVVPAVAPAVVPAVVPAVASAVAPSQTYQVSNVTQLRTADGKNIIIVVQPAVVNSLAAPAAVVGNSLTAPAAVVSNSLAVPAAGVNNSLTVAAEEDEVVIEDSDSDWTPEVANGNSSSRTRSGNSRKKPGRKPEVRSAAPVAEDGKVSKRSYKGIKDKRLRKKIQNVDAARRYRDRKKKEESEIEEEAKILTKRNTELKEKLADIENEFKTMKKLMTDLGLVKFVK